MCCDTPCDRVGLTVRQTCLKNSGCILSDVLERSSPDVPEFIFVCTLFQVLGTITLDLTHLCWMPDNIDIAERIKQEARKLVRQMVRRPQHRTRFLRVGNVRRHNHFVDSTAHGEPEVGEDRRTLEPGAHPEADEASSSTMEPHLAAAPVAQPLLG